MKPDELKNKDKNELSQMLYDMRTKLSRVSFEREANTLKDTSQIKKIKKDVARILTIVKSK